MKRVAAAVAGLAGLVLVVVVAGCGAGQNTQTDSIQPSVNGAFGQVGPIAIRDARFSLASNGIVRSGSSVGLVLTIVNTGGADDQLADVTSPIAGDVEISGDRALTARRAIVVGAPAENGGSSSAAATTTTTTTTTTTPPSSAGSPSSGPSAPSSPSSGPSSPRPTSSSAPAPVEIGKATIVLKGLSEDLFAGKTYPVTFVFRNAGSITIELPVGNPVTARPEPSGESHG